MSTLFCPEVKNHVLRRYPQIKTIMLCLGGLWVGDRYERKVLKMDLIGSFYKKVARKDVDWVAKGFLLRDYLLRINNMFVSVTYNGAVWKYVKEIALLSRNGSYHVPFPSQSSVSIIKGTSFVLIPWHFIGGTSVVVLSL